MNKEYDVQEFTISHGDESINFAAFGSENKEMCGYFMDWWKEVGKEQFDAAIIDL
jgi:hypothetical protein